MTDEDANYQKTMDRRVTRLEVKDEVREKDIEDMKKGMGNLSSNVSKIAAKQDAQGEQLTNISKGMDKLCEHFGAKKVFGRWTTRIMAFLALVAGVLGMNYQFPFVPKLLHAIGMQG